MHRFGNQIPRFVFGAIRKEIERLEDLAVALDAVCTSPFPLDTFLARSQPDAPILDEWQFGLRPVKCLVGRSTGHPRLPGEHRPIVTSEIFLISEEFGWARSCSRWYRLGRPFDDQTLSVLSDIRPIITVFCEVPGFEESFLDLLKRGLILPGKVSISDGYDIHGRRGLQVTNVPEVKWQVMCFAGKQHGSGNLNSKIGEAAQTVFPILGLSERPDRLPPRLVAAAQLNLDCGLLTADIVGQTVEAVLGTVANTPLAEADYPLLDLADLALAIRPGIAPERAMSVLRCLYVQKAVAGVQVRKGPLVAAEIVASVRDSVHADPFRGPTRDRCFAVRVSCGDLELLPSPGHSGLVTNWTVGGKLTEIFGSRPSQISIELSQGKPCMPRPPLSCM